VGAPLWTKSFAIAIVESAFIAALPSEVIPSRPNTDARLPQLAKHQLRSFTMH
jgi:hypothetical protein